MQSRAEVRWAFEMVGDGEDPVVGPRGVVGVSVVVVLAKDLQQLLEVSLGAVEPR